MQYTGVEAGHAAEAYRVMALLNAAIYDATIAAWDAKYAYNRPRPATADPSLATAIPTPASPSYPCEHAVDRRRRRGRAGVPLPRRCGSARRSGGGSGRSPASQAGVALPKRHRRRSGPGSERSASSSSPARKTDGSDAEFDPATMPTGEGIWTGEPALADDGHLAIPGCSPPATSSAPHRPRPPDSPERAAEIAEVKTYPRDANPVDRTLLLAAGPGRPAGAGLGPRSPAISSSSTTPRVIHYSGVRNSPRNSSSTAGTPTHPRAARAYALVSIAGYDATVACWDGKYHYWTARPNQFDPEITTVLPTYPIPDYPSGHATGPSGTATVLAYLFPRDAHFFASRAAENAASRLWAGIHFRSACDAGLQLGRDVGGAVIAYAEQDGAD